MYENFLYSELTGKKIHSIRLCPTVDPIPTEPPVFDTEKKPGFLSSATTRQVLCKGS